MSLFLRKRCLCLGFLLFHLLSQVSASLRCPSRCPPKCPSISPTCAPGVRSVLDGCSCCPVCARQRGESCSEMRPCDQSSGLYCDRSADPNNQTGICMVPEGDNCVFDGVIYRNGEKFEPNCQYFCTCRDGQIGCLPRCQLDVLLPGPDCPAPRKVAVPGECCEKWTCGSDEQGTQGTLGGLALPGEKPSRRGTVKGKSSKQQHLLIRGTKRLCFNKPPRWCPYVTKGKKCLRTKKSLKAIHLQFENCTSLYTYKPRFCGVCSDGRCCTPHNTKTIQVEFQCLPGEIIKKPVMVIGTCTCYSNCPQNNEAFLQELELKTSRGEI
uniref:Cellular communication network factor 3 n=1 Tax=Mus spicilegus TaxID=10103 RepID=A0A8C6HU20_MUSSI